MSIDYAQLQAQLGIRTFMELGLREATIVDANTVRFKMGFAHATAHLFVELLPSDEYAVRISKTRGAKTSVLAEAGHGGYGLDAENLARVTIDKWVAVCDQKGW